MSTYISSSANRFYTALDRTAAQGCASAPDEDPGGVRLRAVATDPGVAHSSSGRRRLSEALRTRAAGGRTGHRKNSPGHRPGHRGMPPEETGAFHDRCRTGQPTRRGPTRTEPQPDAGTVVACGTDRDR